MRFGKYELTARLGYGALALLVLGLVAFVVMGNEDRLPPAPVQHPALTRSEPSHPTAPAPVVPRAEVVEWGLTAGPAVPGSASLPDAEPFTVAMCVAALTDASHATDQTLWRCGLSPGRLGKCSIAQCDARANCACEAYVRSSRLCDEKGMCQAPLSGTGCSTLSFYGGAPFHCSGEKVHQSACMLRVLIRAGQCK